MIICQKFKMQTAEKLRHCLPQKTFFTKIDISDAFLHCPLNERFQKFVSFSMNGSLYFFKAMPFGLNIAPMIYTRLSKYPLTLLHDQGVTCSAYMDDWLIWNQRKEELETQTRLVKKTLLELGFKINEKKSSFVPTKTVTYLGIEWNGESGSLLPSRGKLSNISILAQE